LIEIGTHPREPGKLVWRDRETNRAGILWEDTPADIRIAAAGMGLLPYSQRF
jgi:hypothetical protein